MNEFVATEKLQPTLLDRLCDDEPLKQQESREHLVLSIPALRNAIVRNLTWLFNAKSLDNIVDLQPYPLVCDSVLNYGIIDFTGKSLSGLDFVDFQEKMVEAIRRFEPRIFPDTIIVQSRYTDDNSNSGPNRLIFGIEGQMWGNPLSERLYLRTELDLEEGNVKVTQE